MNKRNYDDFLNLPNKENLEYAYKYLYSLKILDE